MSCYVKAPQLSGSSGFLHQRSVDSKETIKGEGRPNYHQRGLSVGLGTQDKRTYQGKDTEKKTGHDLPAIYHNGHVTSGR